MCRTETIYKKKFSNSNYQTKCLIEVKRCFGVEKPTFFKKKRKKKGDIKWYEWLCLILKARKDVNSTVCAGTCFPFPCLPLLLPSALPTQTGSFLSGIGDAHR